MSSKESITQIEKLTLIKCIKCNKHPKKTIQGYAYNIQICHCDNVYWTLNVCAGCNKPGITLLHQKPKAGDLIICANCGTKMHIFKCPFCAACFYLNPGKYIMGQEMHCQQQKCQKKFKMIVCQCGGEVYQDSKIAIIEGFSGLFCNQCQKTIYYTNCTQCNKTDYYPEALDFGDLIKCSHCMKKRLYVPCPQCNRTINSVKFFYGERNFCNHCETEFQYTRCPYGCGINYLIGNNMTGPLKTCFGQNCKGRQYLIINCTKCHSPLQIEGFAQGIAQIQQCPTCKNSLKFYYCPCGRINRNDTKCVNQTCPPPKKIQTSIQPTVNSTVQDSSYQQKQCKLCFMEKSIMLNTQCFHIMMCQQCYKSYKKTKNHLAGQVHPCPVCKAIGLYVKYKQVMYC